MSSSITRRGFIRGSAGLAAALAVGGAAACSRTAGDTLVAPGSAAVDAAEQARRAAGRSTVTARLAPRPVTIDIGARTVQTWAYGDELPGPLLRATAGDLLAVSVDNRLPTDTSVHWHGVAVRNDMDGVPHLTQDPIEAGASFTYEFTVPDPGTYFYHPHTGVQLDRGLYGVLVVDDPNEPGRYDEEWIVVLDDWVDGTGRTPDDVYADLTRNNGSGGSGPMGGMDHGSMGGMDHGPMGGDMGRMGGMGEAMNSLLLGGAGDVAYPHYLVNGRTADAPHRLSGRPGQRVRIRFVNAGSDTAFRVAVGGHRMTVTHCDGFPVVPVATDALLIGMGERFDVVLTLGDGVFPLVASAEGKDGRGQALIRTANGAVPPVGATVPELAQRVLLGTDVAASPQVRLARKPVDRRHNVALGGTMNPYRWTINGRTFADAKPLQVAADERVRLRLINQTMMFHPMHLHGHTFALVAGGARKDTAIIRPMQTLEVDLDTDNPGQWALHCHNILHAGAGMMTTLSYRS